MKYPKLFPYVDVMVKSIVNTTFKIRADAAEEFTIVTGQSVLIILVHPPGVIGPVANCIKPAFIRKKSESFKPLTVMVLAAIYYNIVFI
jgi:hypothetical protein